MSKTTVASTGIDLSDTFAFTGTVSGLSKNYLATSGNIGDVSGGQNNITFNSTVLTSTYAIYVFEFLNLRPATDDQAFFIRVSKDNLSNDGNIDQRSIANRTTVNDSGSHDSTDNQNEVVAASGTQISNGVGNADGESFSGRLTLFNFNSQNSNPKLMWDTVHDRSDGYLIRNFGGTSYLDRSTINAVKFNFNSGNISNGIINVFGVKTT